MRYDISKPSAPKMPNLGRGTECIKILLSQVSRDMHEPLVPMLFPILGAHISGAEFQYPDLSWKEPTGMMANLVADSGCNKGQLSNLVEAICRDFRQHDEAELKKFVEWQRQFKSKASTKEKPTRPEVAFWFPPSDVTNARHYSALKAAQDDMRLVCEGMDMGLSGDLLSEDLRSCIHHLSEIVGGEITPDETLSTIFKKFCVGK